MILSYHPARAVQDRRLILSHLSARQRVYRSLCQLYEQELACFHSVYCSEAFIVYSSSVVSRYISASHRIASVCFDTSAARRQSRTQAGTHNVSHPARARVSLVLVSQRSSQRYIVYIDCSLCNNGVLPRVRLVFNLSWTCQLRFITPTTHHLFA